MGRVACCHALALATLLAALPARGAPALPHTLDLEQLRALPVQHDGRWPPLDTVARDMVWSVTGSTHFNGHDPLLLLLAWTFDPGSWRAAKLFDIDSAELRNELSLPADREFFSAAELAAHRPLTRIRSQLAAVRGKLDPLQSKVAAISKKLMTLRRVFAGQVIRPIPDAAKIEGAWQPIPGERGGRAGHGAEKEPRAVIAAWTALGKAFRADDATGFARASQQLTGALAALPAAYRPTAKLLAKELRYNAWQPFTLASLVMALGALLAVLALFLRRRWADRLALATLAIGWGLASYGLWLRWEMAGRIPAANMFESLLFLGWGAGAFAVVWTLLLHDRAVLLTASALGALALLLAEGLPLDSFVRPIPPVLHDTIWMSIHVPVIMVSYAVLALAVLIAHVQLVLAAAAPRRADLARKVDALHTWYVRVGSLLLLAGITTGSMWAASSWGRYWGWDPKEVWSLVALLGYLTILHVRLDRDRWPRWAYVLGGTVGLLLLGYVALLLAPITFGKAAALISSLVVAVLFLVTRSAVGTAVKSIAAFWLIIMTYVGVNYLLGTGLHSYGFGAGAVARYLFIVGGCDLALVLACLGAHVLRRSQATPA